MTSHDIIIIGAGQHGLIAAFYLARAGRKPLVLERRPVVGGIAALEEFHPGFRASVAADFHGPLTPAIARDLHLATRAASPQTAQASSAAIFAPHPDGRSLILHSSTYRTLSRIAAFSRDDSSRYLELAKTLDAARPLIRDLLLMTPPEIDHPSSADLWHLLRTGRKFRRLGKKNMQHLLRWGSMAAADFVAEFFDTELLRAVIASRGIFGAAAGPRSAGTTALLLLRLAAGGLPDGYAAQNQTGSLADALASAATRAGAEIRTNAEVSRILVKNGAASGAALTTGEEIFANAVVSGADPKRTFLQLLEPVHLAPSFLQKIQNYRSRGVVARLQLALDDLPNFTALANLPENERRAALSARIHVGPEIDYLERAFDASKYAQFSSAPYLEASIPSLADPSVAPAGKHVMTIHMQYAPYAVLAHPSSDSHSESGRPRPANSGEESAFHSQADSEIASPANWDTQRDAVADTVINTLAQYAPDLSSKILARRVITPFDLERDYALTGGHISHGELSLDQLFTMRPLLGFARYATPIRGLFLCGPGTHPGVALAGASALNSSRQLLKSLRSR